MNKHCIDDEILYKYFKTTENKMLDSLPKEDLSHEFSNRFQKKMNKLIRQEKRTPSMKLFVIHGKRGAAIILFSVLILKKLLK